MPEKTAITKTTKKTTASFKTVLMAKIDEYMDTAFNTDDPEKRQQYRDAIRQMEQLLFTVVNLE